RRGAGAGDGALVQAVGPHRRDHGRVAAVGVAVHGDAVRIGDALFDQVADAVVLVVLHAAAPFAVAGLPQTLAPAVRAAVLRLQHGVAAGGEVLGPAGGVPVELVARPGAAVRRDDGRVGAGAIDVRRRRGQEGRDHQAVAGAVLDQPRLAEGLGVDL